VQILAIHGVATFRQEW